MSHSCASGLGLHYLPTSHKKDDWFIWVTKICMALPIVYFKGFLNCDVFLSLKVVLI